MDSSKQQDEVHQPFSLWWAALAAADETMQGGPLVRAWLRLFSAHLSWIDNTCTAPMGRRSRRERRGEARLLGTLWPLFSQEPPACKSAGLSRLRTTAYKNHAAFPNRVTVRRIAKGDIPDWIAWDPATGNYCLCEAKGSLTGKEPMLMTGQPTCVTAAKRRARGGLGPLRKRAGDEGLGSLPTYSPTDSRQRESVSLLWDPPSDGRALSEGERGRHADGIRRRRDRQHRTEAGACRAALISTADRRCASWREGYRGR